MRDNTGVHAKEYAGLQVPTQPIQEVFPAFNVREGHPPYDPLEDHMV
jgi:hypothetical protein